ncbi:MAG: type I glyceraldehyde-3-phosphate dehydrogenase [Rickettsiales bacterium]|nr:type I glyceraldehyde-3-phosphate dehydrogenase [Rickettsiales bacterium]
MKKRIAINGFGRIGRLVLRAFLERESDDFEIVAINDLANPETSVHLFRYDSVHGPFRESCTLSDNKMIVKGQSIELLSEKDPSNLPWKEMDIDLVMECSGFFTKKEKAYGHIQAGAKRVLISAPSPDADQTIVYGVNHQILSKNDQIVSNGSCTTNCLAPVAAVLDKSMGIESGYMTTVHAYTGDQSLIDRAHSDLRRARAGALSLIPTSTGAAKAVGLVLPELKGKLDGTAIRVPTANVSLVDFTFYSKKKTTVDEINGEMKNAASHKLKGVLSINDRPLVSSDFNHDPHSSIFDVTQTQVVNNHFCRVLSWYDNEWGFSNRMLDTANVMLSL